MDSKTFKEIKATFQTNYFKYIKPYLDEFEKERIKKLKLYNTAILPICIVIFICLLIFFVQFAKNTNNIDLNHLGILIIPIAIAKIIFYAFGKSLEIKIKQNFMPTICKCFKNLNWSLGYNGNKKEFHETGLVNYYNDTLFDDNFSGSYKDVNFEIIEAKLVHETNSGKNRSRHTIFLGIILKLTMPKDFESHTLIRPDGLLKMPIKNLKRTELEDVIFEKKYDVYTNNEVEARVTITTAFMERLNNIEKVFNSQKTYCCFINNKAYFGLHTKRDMFKICSLKKPINNPEFFIKMFEEMISIYRLIDHLKLAKEVNI